jgi:transcriptional regulator with XRE-family HTH domain
MPESFGARLRQRREQQGIAIATIAEQTKIKLSLLEALERDDVSHWPSGIFRRAFIRSYAHTIGLDPDVIVREFLDCYPDAADVTADDSPAPASVERPQEGTWPPMRLRYLVSSAIGALPGFRPASVDRPAAFQQLASMKEPVARVLAATASEDLAAASASEDLAVSEANDQPDHEVALTHEPEVVPVPPSVAAARAIDLDAAARLCTQLGRVEKTADVAPLLQEAARILDAIGLIIWVWDSDAVALRPALAHGYSERVLAQLPTVKRDAANATAAAFRSAQPCAVDGSPQANGALVAPLLTPTGCDGVLAVELPHGYEQTASMRAVVTIFAAMLGRWITTALPVELSDRRLA